MAESDKMGGELWGLSWVRAMIPQCGAGSPHVDWRGHKYSIVGLKEGHTGLLMTQESKWLHSAKTLYPPLVPQTRPEQVPGARCQAVTVSHGYLPSKAGMLGVRQSLFLALMEGKRSS